MCFFCHCYWYYQCLYMKTFFLYFDYFSLFFHIHLHKFRGIRRVARGRLRDNFPSPEFFSIKKIMKYPPSPIEIFLATPQRGIKYSFSLEQKYQGKNNHSMNVCDEQFLSDKLSFLLFFHLSWFCLSCINNDAIIINSIQYVVLYSNEASRSPPQKDDYAFTFFQFFHFLFS